MNQENIQFPEKFSFKKVSLEDWDKFRELRLKGLQTDPIAFGGVFENESKESEEYWKDKFINPELCFYAAEEGNIFVATAGSKKMSNDDWRIFAVYTLPEFRNKNLSKELIDRIINEAKKVGASKVSLFVNTLQQGAINLYTKMDFKIIRTEKNHKMGDGNVYDLHYMEKNINKSDSIES